MTQQIIQAEQQLAVADNPATVGAFFQLMKPRVMSLVIFTGFAGMFLAPGEMHPVLAAIALFAIAAGAGASGAINQWYDRDIDAVMTRTRGRPIPAGQVVPAEALALVKNDDYKQANIPMLPVVAGPKETRKQILIYALILAPTGLVPYSLSMSSLFYLVVAAVMGAIFVWLSFSLYKKPSDKAAWKLFKFSIFYLFILFAALIADRLMATLLFGAGSFIG